MVLVRRIRSRGANIVVEANGEVLFAPTGEVGRWTNRFSHHVRSATQAEAPSNKRPRWAHYGRALRATFTSSTTYQPGRMRVYSAIGSTSPHAYYVDQGTGIYAGNGPYEAKILPPWHRGSPSLYEATWRPGGPGTRKVKPVVIKGQKGQFFFDRGLKRGFESMRVRSFQVPGEGQITSALASIPSGLIDFIGNTVADGAFVAQLEQWRAWRDASWRGEHGAFGNEGVQRYRNDRIRSRAVRVRERKMAKLEKQRRLRKHKEDVALAKAVAASNKKKPKKSSRPANVQQRKLDKAKFFAAMIKKYGKVDGTPEYRDGYWYLVVWGPDPSKPGRKTWIEVRAKARS